MVALPLLLGGGLFLAAHPAACCYRGWPTSSQTERDLSASRASAHFLMNPSALRHRKEVLNVDILQPERCSSQVGDGGKEQVKNRSCFLIFYMVFFCVLVRNVEISHA